MDLSERPHNPPTRRHPWEVVRFDFLSSCLWRHTENTQPLRLLDAGAGDGWFASRLLERLPPESSATCWDALYTDADLSSLATTYAGQALTLTRALPRGSFDRILLLDVLEHVEDDRAFLTELVAHLSNTGVLLFSVPAWPALFSQHDTALGHFRRYTPASARDVLRACGLRILGSGGFFHSLLPVRCLQVLLERMGLRHVDDLSHTLAWEHGERVTSWLEGALRMDNQLSHTAHSLGIDLPGLSFWAVCTKR